MGAAGWLPGTSMLGNMIFKILHPFIKHLSASWSPDVIAQTDGFTSLQYSEEIDVYF